MSQPNKSITSTHVDYPSRQQVWGKTQRGQRVLPQVTRPQELSEVGVKKPTRPKFGSGCGRGRKKRHSKKRK